MMLGKWLLQKELAWLTNLERLEWFRAVAGSGGFVVLVYPPLLL